MKNRIRSSPALIPFFLMAMNLPLLFPSTTDSYDIPERKSESLVIGVSIFQGIRLSMENEYLMQSIPLFFLSSLKALESRVITGKEAEGMRALVIRALIKKETAALSAAYQKLDKGFFDPLSESAVKKIEEQISDSADYLAYLRNLDPALIPLEERYPIVFSKKNLDGDLMALPLPEPGVFCEKNGLDLLVYGSIEEVNGLLFLTVSMWNAALSEEVPLFRMGGSPPALQGRLIGSVDRIERSIRGEPIGYLTVLTDQRDARIEIDDVLTGIGYAKKVPLPAGERTLTVTGDSFKTVRQVCQIAEGEESVIELSLERKGEKLVPFTSFPGGAEVYSDGRFIGKTPFFYPYLGGTRHFLFIKEGYENASCALTPENAEAVSMTLLPVMVDRNDYREMKKREFYRSFGTFVLSISVPLLCYSMAIDYSVTGVEDTFYLWYRSYWATMAVTTFLGIDFFISLFDYISSVK